MNQNLRKSTPRRLNRIGRTVNQPPIHPPDGAVAASDFDDRSLNLKKAEAAQLVNVSIRTIDRLLSADWMPELVEVLGCKRFRRADLEAWVAAGCPKDWRAVIYLKQENNR